MTERAYITIIGGGAVGCAIAYELSQVTDRGLFLIERNAKIKGENQSSRNSGVIHSGIYYPSEIAPWKARFCVEGNRLLYDFCRTHKVPHKKTGKLVVATDKEGNEYLDAVLQVALKNNVPDVRKISNSEIPRHEPGVKAIAALLVPSSGIVDAPALTLKLSILAQEQGAQFVMGNEVIGIAAHDKGFTITTRSGDRVDRFETEILVNCAGLYSDHIARMVNPDIPYEISPARGETWQFNKQRRPELAMNGMNVYPPPPASWPYHEKVEDLNKKYLGFYRGKGPKLGVHLTPTFEEIAGEYVVGRTVTVGPVVIRGVGKEDYRQSLERDIFYERVRGYFPGLQLQDLEFHQAGVLAALNDRHDFIIMPDPAHGRCIQLIGIDSPGLTACIAIARYVKEMILEINSSREQSSAQ